MSTHCLILPRLSTTSVILTKSGQRRAESTRLDLCLPHSWPVTTSQTDPSHVLNESGTEIYLRCSLNTPTGPSRYGHLFPQGDKTSSVAKYWEDITEALQKKGFSLKPFNANWFQPAAATSRTLTNQSLPSLSELFSKTSKHLCTPWHRWPSLWTMNHLLS